MDHYNRKYSQIENTSPISRVILYLMTYYKIVAELRKMFYDFKRRYVVLLFNVHVYLFVNLQIDYSLS